MTTGRARLDILLAGSYNLGFLAIGATPTTRTFLKWWQERLYANCQIAFDKGMFVDQRWIDLVPGLFDGVHILREPEYNVAYWNLHSRSVEFSNGRLTVNGESCRFFHFSGFDPNDISTISKHQNRFTIDRVGSLAGLFEYYRDLLWSNGYRETRQWPYAFGCFSNGIAIPDVARAMYRALGQDCRRFGDPFSAEGPIASLRGSRKEWTASGSLGGSSPVCGTRSTLGDPISNALIRTSLVGIGRAFSRGFR